MRFQSLADWLQWLESCHPREIDLGLQRVAAVAKAMSLSLDNCQVVTVAGTNGKGSCVAALNTLLSSAGLRVGCFTSPHLLRYNERIVVDGEPAADRLIIESFQRIDQARGDISLTYFEFGTLAAIDIFQAAALDVAILEVGLGGRLDAVNIIDADIAIATSIALDHQDWLGSDIEQIGREKAGVFRAGKPAISAGANPPHSLREEAGRIDADFYQAGEDFSYRVQEDDHWQWQSADCRFVTPAPTLPPESIAAAIKALQLLPLDINRVDFDQLARINLPGRFQSLSINSNTLILDVAHNPAAARYLAARLEAQPCIGRTLALFAVMEDKDVDGIITALAGVVDHWHLAALPDNPRAMPVAAVADRLRARGVADFSQSGSVSEALAEVLSRQQDQDRLVVFGSFFTVAGVMADKRLKQ